MDWKIGEKVVVYREGIIEKVEQNALGVKIMVRYPEEGRVCGKGFAYVDADCVTRNETKVERVA